MAQAEAEHAAAVPASTATESLYYRSVDASGKVSIVDSPDKLPAEVREKAERVVLTSEPAPRVDAAAHGARTGAAALPFGIDAASFALGLGAGVLGAGLIGVMLGRLSAGGGRWVLRGVLAAGAAVLIVGAYLGWVRQSAGLGDGTLASPQQLIEDARKAADQVRKQRAAQEREIEEIRRMAD